MRFVRYLTLIGLSFALSGCRSSPSSETAAPSRPRDAAVILHSPRYQEAVRRYGRSDYRGALGIVDQLLSAPGLTQADQAFLRRQQAICHNALSAKPKSASSPPAPPAANAAPADCGPRALLLACRQLSVPADLATLRQAAGTTRDGTSLAGLAKAARAVGLKANGVQMDRNALANLSPPAIAWVDGNHFVAVLDVNGDRATVHDPNQKRKEEISLTALLGRSGGVMLALTR